MTAKHFAPEFLDEIRARQPLTEIIGRHVRLSRRGREHVGFCPFHNEKTPSFTVSEDKGFFHCFGCGAHGDVFGFVMRADNLPFREAVERLAGDGSRNRGPGDGAPFPPFHAEPAVGDGRNSALALQIWREAQPAAGSKVEVYLRARAVTLPVPGSLKFHPTLTFTPTGTAFPAMVAGVQDINGKLVAIHRTYLLPDGSAKAPLSSPKMALGPLGRGAVRLGPVEPAIGMAEGIESALSAMQLFDITVWSALGSRMAAVELPNEVLEIQVFADNGAAGGGAAERAAETFIRQGRRVALRFPPPEFGDWNDALAAMLREACP